MIFVVDSPIRFHDRCGNRSNLSCFQSSGYVCYCSGEKGRASCLRYDEDFDRCSVCLNSGRCIREDQRETASSVCICPSCYSGARCQFHLDSFEVTYDTLLYHDLTSSYQHIVASCVIGCMLLIFIVALVNNVCAFVTFRRPQCLRVGVGNYLLCLSVVNQVTMAFLLLRLIHVIVLLSRPQSARYLPSFLCGLFAYGVENGLYVSYWLVSIVSIERVYNTLAPTGQWLKTPDFSRRSLLVVIVLVLISTSHHAIFFEESDTGEEQGPRSCILSFPATSRDRWTLMNQIVSILHSFVPLLINVGCTVTMTSMVIKSKVRVRSTPRSELT
jgi:hypothetical protein